MKGYDICAFRFSEVIMYNSEEPRRWGRPPLEEQLHGGQLSGFKVDGRKTRECNHCLRESVGLQTTRVVEHNT